MSPYKQSLISFRPILKASVIAVALIMFLVNSAAAATLGVGVGTGKIEIDEHIKPSLSYKLPPIVVFNNGDIESDYEMSVEFNEHQSELKPDDAWLNFLPNQFSLEPGKSQQVAVTLKPGYSAKPGDYFAYLEARPIKKDETGTTAIRIAAATKLYFKIIPANFWQRIYYAIMDFWDRHKAIIVTAGGAALIATSVLIVKKYLKIDIQRKK